MYKIEDQRGEVRPSDSKCEIGAYESEDTVPTVSMSSTVSDPTNTSPIPVTVTFSESVTGFTAGDIAPGNATVGNFAGSGASYSFDLTPSGDGPVTADIAAGVAQDSVLNNNTAATQFSRTYDTTAPATTSFVRQSPSGSQTDSDTLYFRATFSEAVTGVGVADFVLTGTTAGVDDISPISPSVYDIQINGTDSANDGDLVSYNGIVGLDFSGSMSISDLAGNPLPNTEPATDETYTLDNSAPTVDSFTATSPSNSLNIPITAFTASDSIGVTGYMITEDNTPPSSSASGWTGSAPTTYPVASAGSYTLYPWAKDAFGHVSAVYGSPASVSVDTTAPTAGSLVAPNITLSGGTTYSLTVTFSDTLAIDLTSLDGSDIRVTGPGGFSQLATLVSVTPAGSGTPRTATYQITPPGGAWDVVDSGTYTVAVEANQVFDSAGNPVGASSLGSFLVNLNYPSYLPLLLRR